MNWYLISPEGESEIENKLLPQLLALPFTAYHVRKPQWDAEQISEWLKQWPKEVLQKMVIHYHSDPAIMFPVKGYHMSRAQRKSKRFVREINQLFVIHKWTHLSTGFHHVESLQKFEGGLTHAWISPVYPSISKTMYDKAWSPYTWEKLKLINRFSVVALGGISIDKKEDLTEKHFEHAGVKGTVWSAENPLEKAKGLFQ
ncbi:MAG: thiamine-phosphate pyrophosphorylase [Flavobacteriales bacterium]|jgi:thiamine-phosphate pyrophosphorylase